MKDKYMELDLEILNFESEDVIATSEPSNPSCDWLSEIICGKVE